MTLDDVAALLYLAYANALDRDGARKFPWVDLHPTTRDYWRAVAKAAVDLAPSIACTHPRETTEPLYEPSDTGRTKIGIRYRCVACGRTRAE